MKYKIDIPKPCHENWQEMTLTEKGRFCASCQKEVIDFTQLSSYEIALKLKQTKNPCGRFRKKQLEKEYIISSQHKFSRVGIAVGLGSLVAIAQPANAQTEKPSTEIVAQDSETDTEQEGKKATEDSLVTISGTVIDKFDEFPIPDARVAIKNTEKETFTDFDGNFEISIPKKSIQNNKVTLVFSSIGMETKEVELNRITSENIRLAPEKICMDTAILGGITVQRPNIFQRFFNLFRKKENRRY